jgi:hypothetical protein
MSKDPIEEAGGLNLYGFVGNSSVRTVDFLGLDGPFYDSIQLERERNKNDVGRKAWVEGQLRSGPAYNTEAAAITGMHQGIDKLITVFGADESVFFTDVPFGGGAYSKFWNRIELDSSKREGDPATLAHELVHAYNSRRRTGVAYALDEDEGMGYGIMAYFPMHADFAAIEELIIAHSGTGLDYREVLVAGLQSKWANAWHPFSIGVPLKSKIVLGKFRDGTEGDYKLLESILGIRPNCEELARHYNSNLALRGKCIRLTCANIPGSGPAVKFTPDGWIEIGLFNALREYWRKK